MCWVWESTSSVPYGPHPGLDSVALHSGNGPLFKSYLGILSGGTCCSLTIVLIWQFVYTCNCSCAHGYRLKWIELFCQRFSVEQISRSKLSQGATWRVVFVIVIYKFFLIYKTNQTSDSLLQMIQRRPLRTCSRRSPSPSWPSCPPSSQTTTLKWWVSSMVILQWMLLTNLYYCGRW